MKKEFSEKVVFVSGGASGIGYAQVDLFLKQGAKVFACDLKENYQKFLANYPNHFAFYTGDLKVKQTCKKAVQKCLETFFTIDILLNTCGKLDAYTPLLETEDALWEETLASNLNSMFYLTKAILPLMVARKKGVIINMASIASFVGGGGGISYTTSKHAIAGFTKQLALDYAPFGIQINGIAPGAIKTPMNAADFSGDGKMAKWVASETPVRRWGLPEEVAEATLFLASEKASYLQGVILPIDGGWLLK